MGKFAVNVLGGNTYEWSNAFDAASCVPTGDGVYFLYPYRVPGTTNLPYGNGATNNGAHNHGGGTGSAGTGMPHNIVQPSLVGAGFIIRI